MRGKTWSAVVVLIVFAAAGIGLIRAHRSATEPAAEPVQEYSLWLSPSGAQYDQLQNVINELADKHPSHHFMPHLTVLGDIKGTLSEITLVARRIAARTNVLSAPIKRIAWQPNDIWRSFYLEVDATPAFQKLYWDTLEITGKAHPWPYHISLMYTEIPGIDREAIRNESHFVGTVVVMDRIRVCTSGDKPEEWTCPAEVKLTGD